MVRAGKWGFAVAVVIAAGCRNLEEEAITVSHSALLHGAQEDLDEKRYDGAIRKLERAAALKPDDSRAHLNLGHALVVRARQDDVNAEARAAFLSRALTAHRTALELRPTSPQRHYFVGRDLLLLGRPAEAVAHLEKAQELDPKVPFIDARLGDAYRAMKEYDLAIEHYRAGLARPPQRLATMELHEGVGETLAAQGEIDDALKAFALARKSAPSARHIKRIEKHIAALSTPATPD